MGLLRVQCNVCVPISRCAEVGEKKRTLSNEKPDAYPRHVEPVEPRLDVEPDAAGPLALFPLEDTLRDGGDGGVVPGLDGLKRLGEEAVIVLDLGRQVYVMCVCVVSPFHRYSQLQFIKTISPVSVRKSGAL